MRSGNFQFSPPGDLVSFGNASELRRIIQHHLRCFTLVIHSFAVHLMMLVSQFI